MAVSAYITRIKNIRKHSNADRLNVGECFGNPVIVGLNIKEGQLGIYFPTDSRIGIEFATQNKLVRTKDENGVHLYGYLEPDKLHISSIKLRGEKSDGLFMEIESLNDFTDVSKLNEGDTITILSGILICEKYIPIGKKRNNTGSGTNKKDKTNESSYPLFKEHIDTAQLAYNMNVFKEGDLCQISLKMHGCFTAGSLVKAWGQDKGVKIQKIKVGDIVVGHKDGKFIPSRVLQVYQNGKTQKWQWLKVSRRGRSGEKLYNIKCTPTHEFWDELNQTYRDACSFTQGETIYTLQKSLLLTDTQKQILVGMYLGDSYYCQKYHSGELQFSCKADHEDYLKYTIDCLGNVAYSVKGDYTSGYGTAMKRARTSRIPDIYNLFTKVLSRNEENKLSEGIIEYFSPISLAFFYMDDGSLSYSDLQQDRACFAICDYNDHDAKIIVECFSKLGIKGVLYKDTRGYNRIRINLESANKMFEMICKYIPPIMQYKLPEKYRGSFQEYIATYAEEGYIFIPNFILENKEFISDRGRVKYDIHTETENYIVGDCLVHNSSGRTSYTIKEVKKVLPYWIYKALKFLKVELKPKRKWELVTGTRRVVLKDYDGGFYGSNAFRKKWHDFFDGKLKKGESIYYELLGYIDSGQTIMPECQNSKTKDKEFIKQWGETTRFTYGCEEGKNDIYVYRMTMTNEDGFAVEYSTRQIQLRCEQMGVKYVPEFEEFFFTTKEDLMERVNRYVDGADPIGGTHIREGVVVRIEGKEKFSAYKHKSFNFKVLESIIKLDDIIDMEENESLDETIER